VPEASLRAARKAGTEAGAPGASPLTGVGVAAHCKNLAGDRSGLGSQVGFGDGNHMEPEPTIARRLGSSSAQCSNALNAGVRGTVEERAQNRVCVLDHLYDPVARH